MGDQVEKAIMAENIDESAYRRDRREGRGIVVYNSFQLLNQTGLTKDGTRLQTTYEVPYYYLTVTERIDIYRLCSPIFGLVTGRMSRIAGMEWHVTRRSKELDRNIEMMKTLRDVFMERKDDYDPESIGVKARAVAEIRRKIRDVRYDLSNFDAALLRWARSQKFSNADKSEEIENWLRQPNQGQTFVDWVKTVVNDLHVHGAAVTYKEVQNGLLENFYELPGGSVFPIKGQFVGDPVGFLQVVQGFDPRIMFKEEVGYMTYAPRSDNSYGSIPLEALVNKVAESLMFDQRAAQMADGTKPPEKLLVFGEKAPFGELGNEFQLPLSKDEQRRTEITVNESRKEAIRVLSGQGEPVVVDISRADTFSAQSERQRMVREEVGLVFGASNIELNLSGADGTSGRSTSETQERYDLYKGIFPIIQLIEEFLTNEVIPMRFGPGWEFKYEPTVSDAEQIRLLTDKVRSGLYSVNELRVGEMGMSPFSGEAFDKPQGAAPEQPGTGEQNPLYMRGV